MVTKVHFSFEYEDDSEWNFDGEFEDSLKDSLANIMMVTRGTLMASMAIKGTAYNTEGFPICQYTR